jgi:acyl carrier protein
MFVEERFAITLQAYETDAQYLDTIAAIAKLVTSKKS